MRFPASLALLLVVPNLLFSSLAAAASRDVLPFGLTPQGAIIVPITISGFGPVSFLLDTGSNGSVISEQLAASLAAGVVARTTMMSAGGKKEALVARIEHLALGTVRAEGVLATIVPETDLQLPDVVRSGHVVQGVIGQDVLGPLRFTIDYRTRQILWREAYAPAPPHATRFDLEPQDDRFLIRLPQADGELRLVPDSGADALVLFDQAETVVDSTAIRITVGVAGLTGTRAAQTAVVRRLRVGPTLLTDVPAVIIRRQSGSPSVDGLLPLHLFACVTFNGPERQLFIEQR